MRLACASAVMVSALFAIAPAAARAPTVQSRFRFGDGVASDVSAMAPDRRRPIVVNTGPKHEIARAMAADPRGRALLAVTDSGFSFFSGEIAIARVTP